MSIADFTPEFTRYEDTYGFIDWWTEFMKERHETVDVREIYAWIKETDIYKANIFAKDCLDIGIHGFMLDW